MAGVPLLFGVPGKVFAAGFRWRVGSWQAYYEDNATWHWVQVEIHGVRVVEEDRKTRTAALRALERELTRLAAGLDAMGVPRG